MTIHAAKGLEFDTVFLPAWEEGIFPNEKSINEGAIEEERRLAYVAITRACRRCVISNAMSRVVFGSRQYNCPSRFISEMDDRFLTMPYGGAYSSRGGVCSSPVSNYASAPKPVSTVKKATVVGKLAVHTELGSGVVIEDGGDILTIAFKARGIKKVARNFVKII